METTVASDRVDWRPTPAQWIFAVVGLLIGIGALRQDVPALSGVLFVAGYPAACAVIARLRGVVRLRHVEWFAVHQFGMAAIALGWVLAQDWGSAAVNGSWFVSAGVWWWRSGLR